MSNIPFYVWSIKTKEFLDASKCALTGNNQLLIFKADTKKWTAIKDWKTQYILLQNTGLKDRNSIEIFEGDILSFIYEGTCSVIAKVVFEHGSFMLESKSGGRYQDTYYNIINSVLIGNIFQRPTRFL